MRTDSLAREISYAEHKHSFPSGQALRHRGSVFKLRHYRHRAWAGFQNTKIRADLSYPISSPGLAGAAKKEPLENGVAATDRRSHRRRALGHFVRRHESSPARNVTSDAYLHSFRSRRCAIAFHSAEARGECVATTKCMAGIGDHGFRRSLHSSNAPGLRTDLNHRGSHRLADWTHSDLVCAAFGVFAEREVWRTENRRASRRIHGRRAGYLPG